MSELKPLSSRIHIKSFLSCRTDKMNGNAKKKKTNKQRKKKTGIQIRNDTILRDIFFISRFIRALFFFYAMVTVRVCVCVFKLVLFCYCYVASLIFFVH